MQFFLRLRRGLLVAAVLLFGFLVDVTLADDLLRAMQAKAEADKRADWGHWGKDRTRFSTWTSHSNRLIPIYTFGMTLDKYKGQQSLYRDPERIRLLYGELPGNTTNSQANYLDQTDVYRLQMDAIAAGKKHVILIVFDGMDWQTTQATAIYKTGQVYESDRGTGLAIQDYDGATTDYGWFVTSPHNTGTNVDADAQLVRGEGDQRGGYDATIGGPAPWSRPQVDIYLLGQYRRVSHAVTDSASSATSMTSGIKTYNAAINVDPSGKQVVPIARQLQEKGFSIGVVSSVPISHATPAAAYSNNVTRNDYQDLTRDLVGLPSIAHRSTPLPGVDVLIGSGWGETSKADDRQGQNFIPGNKYMPRRDVDAIDHRNGGNYIIVQRTRGKSGRVLLMNAAREAYQSDRRLFGFFGVKGGHLPYQTADGKFNPFGTRYTRADVNENPTLAEMARAALGVLSKNTTGFWLMVEAGDVDWANHSNNLDNAIGAALSGDAAFQMVTAWVEKYSNWNETAVIVTSDHGHYFVLDDPNSLTRQASAVAARPQAATP